MRFDLERGRVELLDGDPALNHRQDALFGFNQHVRPLRQRPHFNHLSSRIQATDLALLGERSVRLAVVTQRSSNWSGIA